MFNIVHSIQATAPQVEALSALDLTVADCVQVESGTLVARVTEVDRVREFWIASHGGVEVYELRGEMVNITDSFFDGKGRFLF